jgi:hypothetical protein
MFWLLRLRLHHTLLKELEPNPLSHPLSLMGILEARGWTSLALGKLWWVGGQWQWLHLLKAYSRFQILGIKTKGEERQCTPC